MIVLEGKSYFTDDEAEIMKNDIRATYEEQVAIKGLKKKSLKIDVIGRTEDDTDVKMPSVKYMI